MATATGPSVELLAHDLFEAFTRLSLSTQPSQRRRGQALKDTEFLTLSILHAQQPMIVGDIQRLLGILPAQMSRIIRALENRQPPLIKCEINPQDKRKIDVRLTPAGLQALVEYQEVRVHKLSALLADAPEQEHEELTCLVRKLNGLIGRHRPVGHVADRG